MNRYVIKTILFLFNSCCGGAQSELIKDTSKNNTHFTGNLDQVKETHGFMTERDSNNWKWKFLEGTLYIFLSKKKLGLDALSVSSARHMCRGRHNSTAYYDTRVKETHAGSAGPYYSPCQ